MMRDNPSSYQGQGYNTNNNNPSNGNSGAWGGGGGRNQNHHHHHHHQHHQHHQHHPQQQQQQQQQTGYFEGHVPVNGFNTQEALELLTRSHDIHHQAARNMSGPEDDRPVIYKGDKGWSTQKNSGAWGQRPNAMASGNNFLAQLKKSYGALQNTSAAAFKE
jgi:G3E family GTPase